MTEIEQLRAELEAIKVICTALLAAVPNHQLPHITSGALRLFSANSLASTNLSDTQINAAQNYLKQWARAIETWHSTLPTSSDPDHP